MKKKKKRRKEKKEKEKELTIVPSSILRRPCWTPSPPTSLVIVRLSVLREILSISSMNTMPDRVKKIK